MKVLFITEGGKQYGLGHITRCLSISQAFSKYHIDTSFIVKGDSFIENLLPKAKCVFFDWQKNTKKLTKIISHYKVVILDTLTAPLKVVQIIENNTQYPVFIDDYRKLNYHKGLIIDWTIGSKLLKKWIEVECLIGSKYVSLRKEFWNTRTVSIRKSVKRILLTFGGSDNRNITMKIVDHLNTKYPKLHKYVIIGKGFAHTKKIKKYICKNVTLLHSLNSAEMKRVILKSDIAICAGGQTTYELARLGLPSIIIKTEENQDYDIDGWKKIGFISEALSWDDPKLFININKKIDLYRSEKVRLKVSRIGKNNVDGKGAVRIAKYILNHYES